MNKELADQITYEQTKEDARRERIYATMTEDDCAKCGKAIELVNVAPEGRGAWYWFHKDTTNTGQRRHVAAPQVSQAHHCARCWRDHELVA